MAKKKAWSRGRPDRGTKPSSYRFTDETIAQFARIAAHYGTTSHAEAIRRLAAEKDSEISGRENTGKTSVSQQSGK